MVCPPVRSIIRSLKLVDYLSVKMDKPCSISHSLSYSTALVSKAGTNRVYLVCVSDLTAVC